MWSSSGERLVRWSSLGAEVQGCCPESPPNFDYRPRRLPPETDLWHREAQLFSLSFFFFIPPFESFQVGDSRWCVGGGVEEEKKTPKQTNKNPGSELKRRSKVDRMYSSLFLQPESIGKLKSMAASQQSHIIINAPKEASVDAPHSLRRWEITKADISIANFGSKHKENLFLRQ